MISSIVLAAGMSTRMGQPKGLLEWGAESLLSYQVRQLNDAGVDEVVVVLGFQSDAVHRTIRPLNCRVMNNPLYHTGRSGSLRIGAKAVNRDAESILIVNVDQPRPASALKTLIAAHDTKYAATRPSHDGHSGHPVVVSGWLRAELLEASEEAGGLRGILRAHGTEIQDLPGDALWTLDLNTPEEYRQAVEAFQAKV